MEHTASSRSRRLADALEKLPCPNRGLGRGQPTWQDGDTNQDSSDSTRTWAELFKNPWTTPTTQNMATKLLENKSRDLRLFQPATKRGHPSTSSVGNSKRRQKLREGATQATSENQIFEYRNSSNPPSSPPASEEDINDSTADISSDTSTSSWDTEVEDGNTETSSRKTPAQDTRKTCLDKAANIVGQMEKPWKLGFEEERNSIKAEFKAFALHAENLLVNDSVLAQALVKQLEISSSACDNTKNRLLESFGEALESSAKIQNHLSDLQEQLQNIKEEMRVTTQKFLKTHSDLRTRHSSELNNLKTKLEAKTKILYNAVQAAKSSKKEQMDMQRHLASYLDEGLGA